MSSKKKKGARLKVTESDIQRTIVDYLRWTGWFCFKIHQSLGSYKGIADLYAVKDGRAIWFEVKKPGGRQSDYQIEFEQNIKEHGGEYYVVCSIEDVMEAIEAGVVKCVANKRTEGKDC